MYLEKGTPTRKYTFVLYHKTRVWLKLKRKGCAWSRCFTQTENFELTDDENFEDLPNKKPKIVLPEVEGVG